MTNHYSEADLLETYYTQPGESMPVMMHLASCAECAARYDKLDRKLREAAACHTDERPATFWSRQRLLIMKKIAATPRERVHKWRAVAAVALAFLLGGAFVYETKQPPRVVAGDPGRHTAVAGEHTKKNDPDIDTPRDPWESDELQDFHGVVQWESWVADSKISAKGDASL